jgi:hypothetical protein
MFAEIFARFCLLWSRRSAKDGCSNFGSLLCGIGAIGVYLFGKGAISLELASWLALAAFIGGGLMGWTIGKPDNLGL